MRTWRRRGPGAARRYSYTPKTKRLEAHDYSTDRECAAKRSRFGGAGTRRRPRGMADTERQTRRRLPVNLASMKINEHAASVAGAGMHVCCTVAGAAARRERAAPALRHLRSASPTRARPPLGTRTLARLSLAHGGLRPVIVWKHTSLSPFHPSAQAAPLAAAARTTGSWRYVYLCIYTGRRTKAPAGAAKPKPNQGRGCDHLSYNKRATSGTIHTQYLGLIARPKLGTSMTSNKRVHHHAGPSCVTGLPCTRI